MATEFGDNRFVDWNLSHKVEVSPEVATPAPQAESDWREIAAKEYVEHLKEISETCSKTPRFPYWQLEQDLMFILRKRDPLERTSQPSPELRSPCCDAPMQKAYPPQPSRPVEEVAKECAIEILRECATHYASPIKFGTNPQVVIDLAIENATRIILCYCKDRGL